MSVTFDWCQDKTKLAIFGKQVFFASIFGTKYWSLNGEFHRANGPAIEYADGDKYWYLGGIGYSESDYRKELQE